MHEQPFRMSEPSDVHPPVAPGAMNMSRPTVWPTVLGVIAIVLGVLGALQGILGMLSPLLVDQFRDLANAGAPTPGFDPFAGIDQYRGALIASSALTMLAGMTLILGGTLLVMRRSLSRAIILFWSAFKVAVVVFGAYIGYLVNQAQWTAMNTASTQPSGGGMPPGMAGMSGFMDVASIIGAVIGIAWGAALPIFMVIWFSRSRIRAEVAGWS